MSYAKDEHIFAKKKREIYIRLTEIGLDAKEGWAECALIMEHITGMKETQQIISDINEFKEQWSQEINRILDLRRQRMPLAYCLGKVDFGGLSFKITPGVLIPRTDTETLVEAVVGRITQHRIRQSAVPPNAFKLHTPGYAPSTPQPSHEAPALKPHLENLKPLRIAEIGVGCGAIAICLLKRLPDCIVWGCDISQPAIDLTLENARHHGVDGRLTLVHGGWEEALPHNFNVIVSNPPYLPLSLSAERSNKKGLQSEIYFEPQEALFDGSEDGLSFYRQFAQLLPAHFAGGLQSDIRGHCTGTFTHPPLQENERFFPFAAFEFGDKQEQSVLDIFKQSGWENLQIKHDLNRLSRVALALPPRS